MLDLISKKIASNLNITVKNSGSAFSLFQSKTLILTIITIVILLGFIFSLIKHKNFFYSIPISFIIGGGLGNLQERFFNPPYFGQGSVTDFINYFNLFIGNIADIFVVTGSITLVINCLYVTHNKGLKNKSSD
ncbi:MAG: signal peptidase II [Bifidobacteriaceae bacterium]|nr:signal peptidase II [Bifidobacteriaceae bacterium]